MSGTILVVDDDADIRATLSVVLEEAGHEVHGAANGAEALAYLGSHPPPRMILLDLAMPVMDGYAMLDAMRRLPTLAGIPVIILSGADDLTLAQRPGVSGYLAKPVDLQKLLDSLR